MAAIERMPRRFDASLARHVDRLLRAPEIIVNVGRSIDTASDRSDSRSVQVAGCASTPYDW